MKPTKSLADAVDRRICFHLKDFPKELVGQSTGVFESDGWIFAQLRGFDNSGIWIENPNFQITWLRDKGNPIPVNERKVSTYVTSVLILWKYIGAIISLDDDEPDKETHSLGFQTQSV